MQIEGLKMVKKGRPDTETSGEAPFVDRPGYRDLGFCASGNTDPSLVGLGCEISGIGAALFDQNRALDLHFHA